MEEINKVIISNMTAPNSSQQSWRIPWELGVLWGDMEDFPHNMDFKM